MKIKTMLGLISGNHTYFPLFVRRKEFIPLKHGSALLCLRVNDSVEMGGSL
uniref:Uncharacterized protein n=1 Tax=Anguilla anguilla TaxID=7936 RepID=A0A0E9XQZ2_ANGAN